MSLFPDHNHHRSNERCDGVGGDGAGGGGSGGGLTISFLDVLATLRVIFDVGTCAVAVTTATASTDTDVDVNADADVCSGIAVTRSFCLLSLSRPCTLFE
ncbi:hypothetical protein HZH68_006758 [Vespula germanica]|uniref:Uncharacterized protein n=1 Tax=Vespula germanica TaxID=30212 RepID=A0A834KFN8_VESGE|nr:hypothetical protein HZH68_006758 [Vespula germanica]